MAAVIVRQEIAYDKNQPFDVTYLSGNSSQTAPLIAMRKMKGVKLGFAGLGGTNAGNKKYDEPNYSNGDVAVRVNDHKGAEYRSNQIKEVIIIDNKMTKQTGSANRETNFATNTSSAAPSASSLTTVWPWSVRAYRLVHPLMPIRTGLM
jgi:hypothetical protein